MAKKKDNNLSASEDVSANDAFSDFAAQINKAAGREVAYIPGRSEGQFIVSRFSSRILAVDVAIGGGYPRGRNIYLVGPKSSAKSTLLCLAIAEVNSAEDKNDKAYLEDSENSFDRNYAYYLGVDPYKLMAVRSYTAEQALDFFRSATASGKFRALFLDSLSAIQPKKLVEGNNDDNVMGGIGRLTSINLSNLEKDKFMCNNNYGYMPTIFYTSQIRKKVGLVFGCFDYKTLVQLADGSTECIGSIVNQKKKVEVMSYNFEKGCFEPKKIVNWYNNGENEHWLKISTTKSNGGKPTTMRVTPNHLIFTPNGEVEAGSLKVGDSVMVRRPTLYNKDQYEIILGSILGDGSLRKNRTNGGVSVRFGHGKKQDNYLLHKYEIFKNVANSVMANSKGGLAFDNNPDYSLLSLFEESYSSGTRKLSKTLLEGLTLLSVAYWYLDDGSFSGNYKKWGHGKCYISCKSYTDAELVMLSSKLESLGLPKPVIDKYKNLFWYGVNSFTFQEMIAKYVPECMEYKIHPKLRGGEKYKVDTTDAKKFSLLSTPILSIEHVTKKSDKFDIEVEDNHNYVAGGVLVHNSPNTTSGGEAPDFYASVRLDMNQGEQIIENDLVVGGKFTFVVTKNKTYPAYRRGEFIMMNDGNNPPYISNEATLMDMAVASGIIEKKGSWYSYLGSNLAQGAINTAKVIENFPTEEKNNMLDLCMSALHPNMKLAFRFKDDTRTTVREETVEKCQEES